jgi:hypothetical protein
MPDFPDIPDFLRISAADRAAAWLKNPPTVTPLFKGPAKTEDPATAELRRQVEAEEKAAAAAHHGRTREAFDHAA